MNIWTKKSIELANQRDYLDLLYRIYPISENARREMSDNIKSDLRNAFDNRDAEKLLKTLIEQTNSKQIVFPIKDSYVAYLKHDNSAINRNPNTVNRITSILYEMGYDNIIDKATSPKETNRQIGPLFGDWIKKGSLGGNYIDDEQAFLNSTENIIFGGSDDHKALFARKYLGYTRNKGLDFLAKFNGKYVLGEAKFLSDFGGSQNSDFEDAELTLRAKLTPTDKKVVKIAIIDGVIYIDSCARQKMSRKMRNDFNDDEVIISAVLLRDFLYSL